MKSGFSFHMEYFFIQLGNTKYSLLFFHMDER